MFFYSYLTLLAFFINERSSVLSSKDKYAFLLEKTLNSSSGVIEVDDVTAKQYLTQHPRNYDLFVMFTTEQCIMCKDIAKQIEKISAAFKEKKMYFPRKMHNSHQIKKPLFFMIVSLSFQDREIAEHYQIQTLPSVILSLSNEIYIKDNYKRKQYFNQYFWRITSRDGVVNAEIILKWLNRIGEFDDIQIRQPIWVFFVVIFILFLIIGVLTLLYIFAQGIILNEKLWLIGCLVFFIIFAGGSYYSFAHSASFIGTNENGPEFFMPGTRSQYGIEGPMIMTFCVIFCFSLVFLSFVMKTRANIVFKTILFFAIMFFLLKIIRTTEDIFSSKNFYKPSFNPPEYYIKGSYLKDQGIIQ
jgi:hypothetical protein